MKALIYRDFSDSFFEKEINPGKISKVFSEYPEDKYAVLVNGIRQSGDFEIKEGDCVTVRAIPHVAGAIIASGIALLAGVYGGIQAYKAKKEAENAQKEAENIREANRNSGGDTGQDPTMPGASNTVATGKTQPFIMGRRLWTPYFLTQEWDNMRGSYWQDTVSEELRVKLTVTIDNDWGDDYDDYHARLDVEFLSAWSGRADVQFIFGNPYEDFKLTVPKGESHSIGDKISAQFNYLGSSDSTVNINGTDFHFSSSIYGIYNRENHSETITASKSITVSEAHCEKDNAEYNYRVLQAGFADQAIEEIRADDEVLVKFNPPVTETEIASSSILFPDSRIEIKQNGKAFNNKNFEYKMDVQEVGNELKLSDNESYADLNYTLPVNAKSVYIPLEFPSGLYTTNDNGSRFKRKIETLVQYSVDGGSTFKKLGTQFGKDGVIETNQRTDLYFILEHTFTDGEVINAVKNALPIKIRISCLTPKTEKGNTCDTMQIVKIRSRLVDEKEARKNSVIKYAPLLSSKVDDLSVKIGLCLKATDTNKDKASKIQIVTCGMARVWNSTLRGWTTEKKATRNPASWLLEVLTSRTHPASRIEDSEIDLENFGDFYEYCEEEGLNIDLVISTGDTKENILKKILEAGNGGLYRSIYGKLSVAIDCKKLNAVAVLNQQNLINFSAEKKLTRNVDGYRVSFTDCRYWKEDTQVFMRDGSDYSDAPADVQIEETKIDSFTADSSKGNFSQVYKYMRRKLNADILRTHSFSLEVGKEGYFFPLYSKIKVQHPALYTGLGSSSIKSLIIKDGKIIALELYSPAQYSKDARYGAVIHCVNKDYSRILNVEYTADSEEPEVLKLVSPISTDAQTVPSAENILSFGTLASDGSFKTITTEITVTEIKQTSKGYQLSGVDYSDSLFDYGTIPQYETNLTKPRGSLGKVPLTNDDLLNKVEEIKAEVESLVSVDVVNSTQKPSNIDSCSGIAEKDGINLFATAGGNTIFDNVKNFIYEISRDSGNTWEPVNGSYYAFNRSSTKDGYPEKSAFVNYKIRSKAVNSYGNESESWTEGTVSPSGNYGTWILSAPTVKAKAAEGIIEISVNDEKNSSVWGFKSYSLAYTDSGEKCTATIQKKDDWNYTLSIAGLHLEKTDLAKFTFTAKVKTEASEKSASCTVNTDNYGTYVLSAPKINAKASEGIIEISVSDNANTSVWGTKSYTVTYTDSGEKCTATIQKKDDWNYTLSIAGLHLEKTDLAKFTFTAKVKTEASEKSANCPVNTTGYGTYVPAVPSVSVSATGRGISLSYSHGQFYEFSRYEVQISKDKSTWYSFGADDTERENESAWQGTAGAVTSVTGNYIAFVLSLEGEAKSLPKDTVYYFRSRTKGYADGIVSGWVSTTAIARCTLANDIAEKAVKTAQLDDAAVTVDKIKASAVTANKISVENLASIQATLGDVTAGSIASHSKKENEKDVPDPDSSLLYLSGKNGKEEFYIGNIAKGTADESEDAHEFLWFKKTGGVASIIFKISNFIVTSVASIIKGVFKIRSKKNTDFIVVNPDEASIDGIAAKTMSVNGAVTATGKITATDGFKGNLEGKASTAGTADYAKRLKTFASWNNPYLYDETNYMRYFVFKITMPSNFNSILIQIYDDINYARSRKYILGLWHQNNQFAYNVSVTDLGGNIDNGLRVWLGNDGNVYLQAKIQWLSRISFSYLEDITNITVEKIGASKEGSNTDLDGNVLFTPLTDPIIDCGAIRGVRDLSSASKVTQYLKANITGNVSGSSGSCTGNAATATKLATARTLNIQDADGTNTGTGASFDGSGNATIKLPATIKANITGNVSGSSGSCTGNAATATNATNDGNGNNIANTYMPKSGGTFTGTIIPKAGTFDGATVSIGRDDGMVTIGNTTNSIVGWTTINNDCKMLGSLLINDHCQIRNHAAISGETSTDSAGNLVLNLYTN